MPTSCKLAGAGVGMTEWVLMPTSCKLAGAGKMDSWGFIQQMRKPYGLLFGVVDSFAGVGMTGKGDGCRFLRSYVGRNDNQ